MNINTNIHITITMTVLSELIYRFNTISVKIPARSLGLQVAS